MAREVDLARVLDLADSVEKTIDGIRDQLTQNLFARDTAEVSEDTEVDMGVLDLGHTAKDTVEALAIPKDTVSGNTYKFVHLFLGNVLYRKRHKVDNDVHANSS